MRYFDFMKRAGILLIIIMAAFAAVCRSHLQAGPIPEEMLARPRAPVLLPEVSVHTNGVIQSDDADVVERWLVKIDPGTFERLANGGEASSNGHALSIKSDWIPALSNLPHTTIRIRYNEETDTYEFLGAGLEWEAGLGVGYEEDPDSEETRGYLQFRKSF